MEIFTGRPLVPCRPALIKAYRVLLPVDIRASTVSLLDVRHLFIPRCVIVSFIGTGFPFRVTGLLVMRWVRPS